MERPVDLSPATACVGLAIRRASRAVSQHYDQALRPTGLRNSQFGLLVALDQGGETPLGALAERLRMDRTTLARNVTVLESRGLVASRAPESDRRSRLLRPTPAGRDAAAAAFPLWQGAQAELAELVGGAELEALVAEADGLVDTLDGAPEPG